MAASLEEEEVRVYSVVVFSATCCSRGAVGLICYRIAFVVQRAVDRLDKVLLSIKRSHFGVSNVLVVLVGR